jgi:hypothetical protein
MHNRGTGRVPTRHDGGEGTASRYSGSHSYTCCDIDVLREGAYCVFGGGDMIGDPCGLMFCGMLRYGCELDISFCGERCLCTRV